MAAKSSDLIDKTSGANLQMESHTDVLAQSAKDLWQLEALDSPPSHFPSWSPAQRLLSSHPNTKYCLEILLCRAVHVYEALNLIYIYLSV